MSDDRRRIELQPSPNTIARRDLLRALLIGGVGLPLLGGGLLSGCGGGGTDEPAGDLGEKVAETRATVTAAVDSIRSLTDAEDADVDGWLAGVNARLAVAWPLLVAASAPALRAHVAGEMAEVLGQLDGLSVPLDYSGPAPVLTRARVQDAWERAHALTGLSPTQVRPRAADAPSMWVFLFLLLLLLPGLSDADAATCAADAATRDTGGRAPELYDLFHPTGPVGCTPCLFSGLISRVSGLLTYLYLGMGARAAAEPGLLLGRDWPTMLVLIGALLFLRFS